MTPTAQTPSPRCSCHVSDVGALPVSCSCTVTVYLTEHKVVTKVPWKVQRAASLTAPFKVPVCREVRFLCPVCPHPLTACYMLSYPEGDMQRWGGRGGVLSGGMERMAPVEASPHESSPPPPPRAPPTPRRAPSGSHLHRLHVQDVLLWIGMVGMRQAWRVT